ncbi:hypothetical protein LSAT2_028999 [Lamellibrachia satsuma]|nr:hypothetical protein LSAT2_028999 [Lamellibrachia satsuma]
MVNDHSAKYASAIRSTSARYERDKLKKSVSSAYSTSERLASAGGRVGRRDRRMAGLFSAASGSGGAGLSGYGSSRSSDAQAESKRVTCGFKNERITDPSVLKRGDTIGVKGSGSSSGSRTGSSGLSMEYYHLGIYLGHDEVIDYVNDSAVRRIHLNEFTQDDTRPLYRIRYTDAPPAYEPKKITERAMENESLTAEGDSRLGVQFKLKLSEVLPKTVLSSNMGGVSCSFDKIKNRRVLKPGDAIGVEGSSSTSSPVGSSTGMCGYYHLGIYLGGPNQEVIDYVNTSDVRRIRLTVFTENDTRPLFTDRLQFTPTTGAMPHPYDDVTGSYLSMANLGVQFTLTLSDVLPKTVPSSNMGGVSCFYDKFTYRSDLRRGDAIAVEVSSSTSSAAGSSTGHYHFGIYVGGKNQEVIDYVHTSGVRRIRLKVFTEWDKRPLSRVHYDNAPSPYPPATVAERAEQFEKNVLETMIDMRVTASISLPTACLGNANHS